MPSVLPGQEGQQRPRAEDTGLTRSLFLTLGSSSRKLSSKGTKERPGLNPLHPGREAAPQGEAGLWSAASLPGAPREGTDASHQFFSPPDAATTLATAPPPALLSPAIAAGATAQLMCVIVTQSSES